MRVGFDSNILIYLAGVARSELDRIKVANLRSLMGQLPEVTEMITPVQAVGELFTVLRRTGTPAAQARDEIDKVAAVFQTPASSRETALAAADLVVDHKLQFWDAMIVSASAEAGCTLLLSEDMQHGFVTRGMTIVNPLAKPMHPKLASLLADA